MAAELKFTAQCTQWFWNNYPEHRGRLRRIKNELDNHPYKSKKDIQIQLSENKATGIIPGDSDLYWIARPNHYIELKIPGGKQSDAQKEFQALVEKYGYVYHLIDTFGDFKNLMLTLLHEEEETK